MEIDKYMNNEKTVFNLIGRLDTTTAPDLQNALIPEFDISHAIELDFSDLAYISSAGLRVLLLGEKTAKAKSALFSISNVSEEVMEVFEMTGFASILTII